MLCTRQYKTITVFVMHKSVDIIFVYFQNNFDNMPHMRLVHLGSTSLASLLANRKQAKCQTRPRDVRVPNTHGPLHGVCHGVVEGSVRGPVFFFIHVNDMDAGHLCKVSKFTDESIEVYCG